MAQLDLVYLLIFVTTKLIARPTSAMGLDQLCLVLPAL
jgi:hypothetical protein